MRMQKPSLDAVLRVRLTNAERRRLRALAAAADLTLSAYARRRILGHVVVSKLDGVTIGELCRVGGLLRHTHHLTGGAHRVATAAGLHELELTVDAIRAHAGKDCRSTPDHPTRRDVPDQGDAAATENPPTRLDAITYVRMTNAEKRRIREQTDRAGQTLSAFSRRRLLGHAVVPAVDQQRIHELREAGRRLKRSVGRTGAARHPAIAAAIDKVHATFGKIRTHATEGSPNVPEGPGAPDPAA